MYFEKNKGKIIIKLDNIHGKLNSMMEFRGIAKNAETALTTLLVNFVSLSLEKGKDPHHVIEQHFNGIVQMLKSGKKIDNS
jgi:hypothetical protein